MKPGICGRHISCPVRWDEQVKLVISNGRDLQVRDEVGPVTFRLRARGTSLKLHGWQLDVF
jgi:hypothetical protein